MRTGNKPTIFGVTKQSGLDLEKEPRPSGRGEAFFLTSLFIELIEPIPPCSFGTFIPIGEFFALPFRLFVDCPLPPP